MSKRNGDKARANVERKKKMLRRKRNQELRKALESKTTGTRITDPSEHETKTGRAEATSAPK